MAQRMAVSWKHPAFVPGRQVDGYLQRGDTSVQLATPTSARDVAVSFQEDLTGSTVTAEVRGPGDALVATLDVTVEDTATGTVTFDIAAATSADLAPGRYVWDAQVERADGSIFTPFAGLFHVGRDATI